MEKSVSFEERFLPKLFNMLYIGLLLNLSFAIAAGPFVLNLLLINFQTYFVLLLPATMFFLFPSLAAMFASYDIWFKENSLNQPVKVYFTQWKKVFLESVKETFLFGSIGFANILSIGELFGKNTAYFSIPLIFILLVISSLYFANLYLRIQNPTQNWNDTMITAFYFLCKKWYLGIVSSLLFGGLVISILLKPVLGTMIAPAIMISFVYLSMRGVFSSLRKNEFLEQGELE